MYVTDANGKLVQFSYYNDDSDEEFSSPKKV